MDRVTRVGAVGRGGGGGLMVQGSTEVLMDLRRVEKGEVVE